MAASSGHGQEGDETSFDACILILESWNTWGQWRSTRCAHLCVLGYLTEINLRQRSLQVGAPHSARAALEPLRVVTIAVPGVPAPLRTCTRPTPEAVAVALALGCTLPSRLPLPPQPDPAPPPHVEVVTRPAKFDPTFPASGLG